MTGIAKGTFIVFFGVGMLAGSATAAVLQSGHADLGLGYEEGWHLHIHVEHGMVDGLEILDHEYEPDALTVLVPNRMTGGRPAGAAWDPIGNAAGANTWLLPAVGQVGVPFLGIGAEEIAPGDFVNDALTLTLAQVVSPSGNGHFALYTTDGFGQPQFGMSSYDGGITAADAITVPAGGHMHFNYSFTELGLWAVTFEASGTHWVDGPTAGSGTYYFHVVPEPAALAMLGLGIVLAGRRGKGC